MRDMEMPHLNQRKASNMVQAQNSQDSAYLNTVASVTIAPIGQGEELSKYVAQVIKVIRDSGLSNETNAMSTVIEGDLSEVMQIVEKAARALAEQGYRTEVSLKLDIRQGKRSQIHQKVELIDQILSARQN